MNIDNSLIYENGIRLTDTEREWLSKTSKPLNDQIYLLLKKYHPRGFTTQEIQAALEQAHGTLNKDSIRRGTTQQTDCASGHSDYQDEYGRFRLVKTTKKRLNPETGIHVTIYTINERFSKPPTHREILARNNGRQQNFHSDLFDGAK